MIIVIFLEILEDGQTFLDNALKKSKDRFGIHRRNGACRWFRTWGGCSGWPSRYLFGPIMPARMHWWREHSKLLEALRGVSPEKRGQLFGVSWFCTGRTVVLKPLMVHWQGKISERPLGNNGFAMIRYSFCRSMAWRQHNCFRRLKTG